MTRVKIQGKILEIGDHDPKEVFRKLQASEEMQKKLGIKLPPLKVEAPVEPQPSVEELVSIARAEGAREASLLQAEEIAKGS